MNWKYLIFLTSLFISILSYDAFSRVPRVHERSLYDDDISLKLIIEDNVFTILLDKKSDSPHWRGRMVSELEIFEKRIARSYCEAKNGRTPEFKRESSGSYRRRSTFTCLEKTGMEEKYYFPEFYCDDPRGSRIIQDACKEIRLKMEKVS